ncbi:unnamed protein product [Arabis nemorensis]|uniref:Fatty acid desaturase N-terminal domain-containing protein n=1 Tax=Arabis nemorensis TaxID=586526 RepID=A0A565CI35_9BRAS|nr:unnamed protein product [Arabis nemorensis]
MASWVLSECGIKPLPRFFPKPRTSFSFNPTLSFNFNPPSTLPSSRYGFFNRTKNWALNVTTPITTLQYSSSEEHTKRFDPGAPPPFNLADIRAAIPKHCWVKNPWRSMSYVVRDVAIVFGLAVVAAYFNSWLLWPLYCGHGSFSNDPRLNSVVGHLLHSSILVPYHGWRISHITHHQNHGHVENDESWHPLPESIFKNLKKTTQIFRFTLPLLEVQGKTVLIFILTDLFLPKEKKDVQTSTACWTAMAALLVCLNFVMGPIQMLKLYGIPYWIFVMWLDFVTYLHHHGHEDKLPWYRGKEWSYLRGGLTTLDRDYGWINNIHHDIGTHVIHHLFPQIPHYNLVEATEAAKPVLGKYYREPKNSGPLPLHLLGSLIRSMKQNHFVSDTGDVVYYEAYPKLDGQRT